jgi:lysophospholipase L1-like esterase
MFRLKNVAAALALAALAPSLALAQVDFTRYVAIGDSLTAAFSSGGVVVAFQRSSYPALLHRQATGGAAGFEQPLVSEPGILPLLQLVSLQGPVITPKPGPQGQPLNLNLPRPYNNLGVPGARVHDTVATTTGGLHDLVLRNPAFGNTTALQQALGLQPTFVTIWIGNNDALGAALAGRVIEGVTLTPLAQFEADFRAIVNAFAQRNVRMAIANIPDVTAIPFVATVPPVVVNPQTGQVVLVGGQPVPLIGPSGPLAANDHVLLTAATELRSGKGIPVALGGTGQPLSDEVVLSAAEAATISSRIDAYNAVIASAASQANAALVDNHAFFDEVATEGISLGGVDYSAAFLSGGIFSYDGVHPADLGYALVANRFIESINEHYDVDIPLVDLFPFVFGPPPHGGGSPVVASQVRLSDTALRNLRWALNVTAPARAGSDPGSGPRPVPRRGGLRPLPSPRWH